MRARRDLGNEGQERRSRQLEREMKQTRNIHPATGYIPHRLGDVPKWRALLQAYLDIYLHLTACGADETGEQEKAVVE